MAGGLGRGRHRGNSRSVLDRLVTATAHQLRMIVELTKHPRAKPASKAVRGWPRPRSRRSVWHSRRRSDPPAPDRRLERPNDRPEPRDPKSVSGSGPGRNGGTPLHSNAETGNRCSTLDGGRPQMFIFGYDLRLPLHPQRFVHSRHKEEQPNARIFDDVPERVHLVVTRPVGKQQRLIVQHFHEPGRVASRRTVGLPIGIGRAQNTEGR